MVYFFFPMLVLPSAGWNQNCPPLLQAWGCRQKSYPHLLSLLSGALGWQSREKPSLPPTSRMTGQAIQSWAPEWQHVCCYTTKTFPECWYSGCMWGVVLVLKGSILLCSEERHLELVSARFGKWGCWGRVRGLRWNKSSVSTLLKAGQSDESPVILYSSLAFGTLWGIWSEMLQSLGRAGTGAYVV